MFGYEDELQGKIDDLEEEVKKWKEIAKDLYNIIQGYCGYGHKELYNLKIEVMKRYEEANK